MVIIGHLLFTRLWIAGAWRNWGYGSGPRQQAPRPKQAAGEGRRHKALEEALGLEAIWTVLETPEDRLPF